MAVTAAMTMVATSTMLPRALLPATTSRTRTAVTVPLLQVLPKATGPLLLKAGTEVLPPLSKAMATDLPRLKATTVALLLTTALLLATTAAPLLPISNKVAAAAAATMVLGVLPRLVSPA